MLIYAGTYDWQCNWVANQLWVDKLEWYGRAAYLADEWREWEGGKTKGTGDLVFATVRGAGHMVPHDKPLEALIMVSRWIAGEAL